MQLVNVEPIYYEFLYRLLQERPASANISHSEMPSIEEHVAFVESEPYSVWYIMLDNGMPVGSVYIGRQNNIGIAVAKEYNGMGYASMAIEKVINTHKPLSAEDSAVPKHFVAHISPENDRSIELFTRLGFEHVENTYALMDAV